MRLATLAHFCLTLALSEASLAENRALLIGVGQYQVANANLTGVEEDIAMMREAVRILGFDDSQVKVIMDSEATLAGIRRAIEEWLVDDTRAGDRVFIYHSGHGTRIPDVSGDEADGSDEALLPFDFEETAIGGGHTRLDNVLLDDDLGRLLARIRAREVVVLVDSCNSGTMTKSIGRWTSKFYSYPGIPRGSLSSIIDRSGDRNESIILLSAALPEQDAQTSVRGALFTQGVLDAVRRAQRHGFLSLEQLQIETEEYIRQEVGHRKDLLHEPMLTGHPALRSINLFLPSSTPRVVDEPAASQPAVAADLASPQPDLWNRLELLVRDADAAVHLTTTKEAYRSGESLELSVVAPRDGYIHILNLGDQEDELRVLYPNAYQSGRHLRRGQTLHIPDLSKVRLVARLPRGLVRQKNLLVAILTPEPLTLPDREADPQEVFRALRFGELTRSIRRSSPSATTYSAGQVVIDIEI